MPFFENDLLLRGLNRVRDALDPLLRFDYTTKNYADNFKHNVIYEHFFGNLPNSWGTQNTGGGSSTTVNSISAQDSFGIIRHSTGTSSTGRSAIHTGQNMTLLGGSSVHSFGGRFRVPTLSIATQRFTIRKGLSNAVTGATDPTDGVYLRHTDNINGGFIQLVCRRANIEAVFNSTFGFAANDWINWRIEINAALNQVDLYLGLNNNQPAFVGSVTSSASIPLNTTVLGMWSGIFKSVGETARKMDVDLLFYDIRNLV